MTICWIVVTDSAEGRIFSTDIRGHELREIEDLIHSDSRTRNQDLTSDRSGRAFGRAGGGQQDMSRRTSAHDHEVESFARQIAERINSAHKSGDFRQLRLSAPPAFLGLLRKLLDSKVLDNLEKTIDKNLVHESIDAIKSHFFSPGLNPKK